MNGTEAGESGMDENQSRQMEAIYREYVHEVMTHAYRLLGNWELAWEATQEAFRIACEKSDDLLKSQNQIGWLKNTTKFVALNMTKQHRAYAKLLVSLDALEDCNVPYVADSHDDDKVNEFCGITDSESLEMLEMLYLQGHSYRTVAKKYGISLWACYKRVERLLEKIKKK